MDAPGQTNSRVQHSQGDGTEKPQKNVVAGEEKVLSNIPSGRPGSRDFAADPIAPLEVNGYKEGHGRW